MRRLVTSLLVAVVAVGLLMAGCAPAAPAPAPTSAPAAPTKAPEPTKPAAAPAPTTAPAAAPAAPTKAPAPTAAPAAKKVDWPEKGKTITIIVPYAAGGATDTGARLLATDLEKLLATPVQVVNKPGASSQVGLTELFNSKPDGYTLAEGSVTTTISQMVDPSRGTPYKTKQDFSLVASHHRNPQLMAVKADSPWKTIKDLVDQAKANPDKIRVADAGLLSLTHLTTLQLGKSAGVSFASVHFSGGAESVPALLGGHVEALAGAVTDVLSLVNSGQVRVLAMADTQPTAYFPGVPTMASQGYNVIGLSGTGVLAPKGTPKETVDILTDAIKKILETADQKKKLTDLGFEVRYLNPTDYAKLWDETEAVVAPIFKEHLAKPK